MLFLPLRGELHPYYIGVSELQLYPEEQRLELSIRLFTDDFENALQKADGKKTDLLKSVKDTATNARIRSYLLKRVAVHIDKLPVNLSYLGYEVEADACWMHLEGTFNGKVDKVHFRNTALFEFIPTQQHIVHIQKGDYRKSGRLTREKAVIALE